MIADQIHKMAEAHTPLQALRHDQISQYFTGTIFLEES